MGDLIIFPLTWRAQPPRRMRRAAEIAPFPFSRRRYLVERHARAMRALSLDEAERYLDHVVDQICSELEAFGVTCAECRDDAAVDFLSAVGRELHGPDFQLEAEEVMG